MVLAGRMKNESYEGRTGSLKGGAWGTHGLWRLWREARGTCMTDRQISARTGVTFAESLRRRDTARVGVGYICTF